MRAKLHKLFAIAICLAVAVSSLGAPEAFALSTVTMQTGPTTFSPNGDGQDDVYVAKFHLSQPGNVTARVSDAVGGTVAVLAQNQSFSAGSQTVSWDGRADGGLIVADGSYTLSIESTDADNSPTSASVVVVVDTRAPGRLVAPVTGSSLSGLVDFVFEPVAGVQVSYVYFALSGCSWYAWAPDAEGLFAVRQADTGACQPGDQSVTAQAYWVDQFGVGHYYNTVPVAVTMVDSVAPTVTTYQSAVNQVLALSEPGRLSTAWFATRCTDGSLVSWSWAVKDASGAIVRTGPTSSPQRCGNYYGYDSSMTWDGLDDADVQVPDGSYVVTATATDEGDLSSSLDFTVLVDSRIPGSLVAPEPGASVSKLADFEFEPVPGMQVSHVYFWLPGCGWYAGAPDADGLFAVRQADTAPCQSGDQPVTAQVYWIDQFGAGHYFNTAPFAVTVIDTAAPTVTAYSLDRQVVALSEPGQLSSTLFAARCSDAALVTWSWTVKNTAGAVVRTGTTSSPEHCRNGNYYYPYYYDSSMSWDGLDDAGVQVPDGSYVVTGTATDEGDLSSSVDFTALVDSRTPGSLVAPEPGASVSELADFEFEPAPGMQVSHVYFALPGCGWYAWARDADGLFAVRQTDTGLCQPGDQSLTTQVYWLDQFGAGHYFNTAPVPVTVADSPPTVTAYGADKQVLALTEPGRVGTGWFATRCSDASLVSWSWTVKDASGAVVRTGPTSSPNHCHNYQYYSDSAMAWDGLDDADVQVPDGSYVVTATATDEGGLSRSLDFTALVDTRVPGILVEPAAGSQLSGRAAFVFLPTTEFEGLNQVSLWMNGMSTGMYNPSPDGVWRTTYPMGSVPAGPTTLTWVAYWIDDFGGGHWFTGGPIDVAVDPTAISLDASIDPIAGKAPFGTTLTLTASDPNDRPVTVKVDWGDGTTEQSRTISLPYDPVTLDHTFADPGTYNVVVTASNGSTGFASRTIPVSVAGAPNQAPTVALSAAETGGFAPFNSLLNLTATDPNGDALTMRIDFGDGSPALTGPLTSDPIAHVFAEPGTYLVRAQVSDGRASTAAFTRITVVLSEPLRASAGDDLRGAVGSPLLFDGSTSAPAVAITKYAWDFGDGNSASGSRVEHTYTNPGTYKVKLTVTSGAKTSTDEAVVVVEAPPAEQGLTVTITSGETPVAGATALIIMPDGTRVQQASDDLGRAFLPGVADGDHTVYVVASGYQPATATAMVHDGVGSLEMALARGELAAATLDARPMTYNEVVAAGVSVADPDNYHAFEATINLYFEPVTPSSPPPVILPVFVIDDQVVCRGDCSGGGGSGEAFTVSSPSGTSYQYLPKVIYVADQPIIQWLVIPTSASFLKQYFEVQMIVQNLTTDFTFEQGTATLTLPSGLSLASTAEPQSLDHVMPPILGGSSATVAWVVRGDAEGMYDITADYTASVEPLGVSVRIQASTQTPLHVWGASALKTTIYVDDVAMRWSPYEIEVVVENVTNEVPVHNFAVELVDPAAGAAHTTTPYVVAPGLPLVQGTASIPKSGTFRASYTIFPGIGSEKTKDLIFELRERFMTRTGGDVDMNPEIVSRAPREGLFSYPIDVRVMQNEAGVDFAHLEYNRPDTTVEVDHYLLYTRHTLNAPGRWTQHSTKWPFRSLDNLDPPGTIQTDTAFIMATERAIGRYYGLATVYTDGTIAYQHKIGFGPARYVALGDSYSSGEGVPGFEPGTAKDLVPTGTPEDNECHRSQAGSYSRLLGEDPALEAVLTPVEYGACSGAVTKDVFEENKKNPSEKAQNSRVNQFTDLITLSMGGNDIGFGDIAMACVLFDCSVKIGLNQVVGSDKILDTAATIWDVTSPIMDAVEACTNPTDLASKIWCVYKAKKAIDAVSEDPDRISIPRNLYNGILQDRLVKVYVDLANRAPHAQIVVVKYPQITDSVNTGLLNRCHLYGEGLFALSGWERRQMNLMTNELNNKIEQAVKNANEVLDDTRVLTVDPASTWDEPLCKAGVSNPDSYMNTLVNPVLPTAGNNGPVMYSFHPNALGHQAMRDAIKSQVKLKSGKVEKGETLSLDSSIVPQRTGTLRAQVAWSGSTVGLALVAPSGRTFGAGDVDVRAGSTPTTAWLEVDSPEPGSWTVQVTGIDVQPEGEPVQVMTSTSMKVLDSPTASVNVQADETNPQAFSLDASASTVSQGTATFSWLLSDGTAATGPRVDHVFTNNGPRWASLQVNDGISSPTYHPVELGIAPEAPNILPVSLVPATAGTPWSHQFEAGGYPEPQFTVASGTIPEGLTLDPSGLLSGTPRTGGEFSFTLAATNDSGTAESETLTLVVDAMPKFGSIAVPDATVGSSYEYQLAATGYPAPTFALTSGELPDGVTLSQAGALTGQPKTAGEFTFEVTASNSVGEVTTEPITLLVSPPLFVDTTPPTVTGEVPAANAEGWYQAPVTVTWTATDPDPSSGGVTSPQPTTVSTEGRDQTVTSPEVCDAAGNCAKGSVQVSIDLTAPEISAAAVVDEATGVHVARFTCTDALSGVASCPADQPLQPGITTYTGEAVDLAGNQATAEVTLSPPVLEPVDLAAAILGTPYTHQLVATGTPSPAFSLASGHLPAGLKLDASGLISGTPTESGSFSITVRADNELGSDTSDQLELTVAGAPTFTEAAPIDAWEGTPYFYQFKADGFPAATFAVASGALPDGLEMSSDGLLSGTPTAVGTFTFGVMASNSVGSVTAQDIVLVVSPAPIDDKVAPVVSSDVPSPNSDGWYNTPVVVTWTAVDPEPSSGGVMVPDPTNVATEGENQLVTSPEVCDAAGNCATGSVTLSIDLTSPTITAWVVDAPAGSPEGAKVVTFTCADELSGLATCPDDVAIVGGMADPITGTVTDRAGNTATTTITVSAPLFTSKAPPLEAVVGEEYSFTFAATGLPLPSFAVASGSLPPGVALASTGELTGTATVPGAFTFSVAATSLSGRAESGPYTVRVLEPAPGVLNIPTQTLPGAVVGRPYSSQLTARGGTAPYAWSSQGRTPSGIDIAADGTVSGVPTKAGTYAFKVTVKDAARGRATLQVTVVVTDPEIELTPTKLPNGKVGRVYKSKIKALGGAAPYIFTLDGATSVNGVTLSPTGVLSGKPRKRGTFEFIVRVTDVSGAVGWRQLTWKVT